MSFEMKTASLNAIPSHLLKQINDPPSQLYYRGNLELIQHPHLLAVVGSRKANHYGKAAIQKLLPPLINKGLVVVSGLAYGIDSLSHQACVDLSRPTIAVLGSGIDDASIYPPPNKNLAHRILETGGLLLSEYSPGTPSRQHRFPERNRIIAGLCPATLVVQAALKSGSLITARLALEYNRDVLAVPGSITDTISQGTNQLIRAGAAPALASEDIAALYQLESKAGTQSLPDTQLTTEQGIVMQVLTKNPSPIDDICAKTNLSANIISPLLIELELMDLIEHVGQTKYVRK